MRLALRTDYALRILMYLAVQDGRTVPVGEIAERYGISEHHIMKVAQMLARKGWVRAQRGRQGGVTLAAPAGEIRVGAVVREFEPDFELVNCFQPSGGDCVIAGACTLQNTLHEALNGFLAPLDRQTLADLARPRKPLAAALHVRLDSLTGRRAE